MVFNVRESDRIVRTDLPREIEEINNIWIPMKDGTRLSAKMWIPKDAKENPVPAILEYIPYRKNEFTALRDSLRHPYFAGHGYASIRVDIRGSGDSEGILYDEYLKQEQDDALEVLEWIGKQEWFTGGVGMIGKSWGGFNGLQVAARQHPLLKAVITLCSTDDRYADDVHYKGGTMLASDMLWWASTMLVYNARPQDPEVVGDSWRENWLARMEKTPPYVEEWVRHQRRDEYWQHGSVCEDYSKITIPVFAVGGWADGYTNAVFRLLENLSGPRKGLVGPWAHEYPEVAVPGPQIGFLQEAIRWYDQWLKEEETGIMDEPMVRAYVQDSMPPQTSYDYRYGKWVAEEQWPPKDEVRQPFYLQGQTLTEQPAEEQEILVSSVQQHGLYAGVFCPFGQKGDLSADQRLENGYATVFTGEPLTEDMNILGFPTFSFEFSSDEEIANIAVRLNEVAPDGAVNRITWGVLNLTHRESHEFPEKLVPHQRYEAMVELNAIGYRIPAGHRLEVAIAPTYWPHVWPAPRNVNLTVYANEKTYCEIPVREPKALDDTLHDFQPAETYEVLEREILREAGRTRDVKSNILTGEWILDDYSDEGCRRLPSNGMEYGSTNRNVFKITEGDPLSAEVQCDWTLTLGRGEWQTALESTSKMSADEEYFYLMNHLIGYEGEEEVFNKVWETKVKRDHI